MQASEIDVGETYGYRRTYKPTTPLVPVTVLGRTESKKWRVERADEDPPRMDFAVRTRELKCAWVDAEDWLRDEAQLIAHRELSQAFWAGGGVVVVGAMGDAFDMTGETAVFSDQGFLGGSVAAIQRVAQRAGFSVNDLDGYVDSSGVMRLTPESSLELAKRFAAAEPETVALRTEISEREDYALVMRPGGAPFLPVVEQERAQRAIVRSWAGIDALERRERRNVAWLFSLVEQAIADLQRAGLDRQANSLARQLDTMWPS